MTDHGMPPYKAARLFRLVILTSCCIAPTSRMIVLFGNSIASGRPANVRDDARACIFVDIYKRMVPRSIDLLFHQNNLHSFPPCAVTPERKSQQSSRCISCFRFAQEDVHK